MAPRGGSVRPPARPQRGQLHEQGAQAITSLHRLVRTALMHAIDNDAVKQSALTAERSIGGLAAVVSGNAAFTFVHDMVFVCGQLLKAARLEYEAAADLASILHANNVSELSFEPGLRAHDLLALAGAIATASRDASRRDELLTVSIEHVNIRKVDSLIDASRDEAGLPESERILRLYATALVVMRDFFDDVAAGSTLLPHRVKRLAQRFVSIADANDPALLGMLTMAGAHRDDAGRAVQSAILTLAVGRQLTRDTATLSRLVLAALMAETGRVRLAGAEGRDRLVALDDEVEMSVPPAAGAVCLATAGASPVGAARAVLAFETTWLERIGLLGSLYGRDEAPLASARLVRMVRAFLDFIAPRDARVAETPPDALASVRALPDVDPVLFRLLVAALGVLPTGTVVELEAGEWAVVLGPSDEPTAHGRPRIKVVTDTEGRAQEAPATVDLGDPQFAAIRIARVLDSGEARFNVTRAFVS